MSNPTPPAGAVKFVQKDPDAQILAATVFVLFALFFGLEWLFGDWGGFAILPALTLGNSRPESRREWLLASLAAGLVAGLLWAGTALGSWLFGFWPPTGVEGAYDRLLVASPGLLPAIFVSYLTIHSLGRRPMTPGPGDEKTGFDIGLWQGVGLLVAALVAFALLLVLERAYLASDCGIWLSLPLQGSFVILFCGGTIMLAWPAAGKQRAALLGRAILGVVTVGASHPLGRIVHCLNGDWSSFADFMGGMSALAIYIAAVTLTWWQLRRFARHHGMLDFADAN